MSQQPFTIIEIVGPAGSGKTTLCELLTRRKDLVMRGRRLQPNRIADWPFFVTNGYRLLPQLYARRSNDRRFTRDEVKKMIVLNGWHRVLFRQSATGGSAILLDQGPVFSLATLNEFGPSRLKESRFALWWDWMFQQWANCLSTVVWLDAPDEVLLERIRHRDKAHDVKLASWEASAEYLERYRTSFSHVVSRLVVQHPVNVMEFDTSLLRLEQIAHDLEESGVFGESARTTLTYG